MTNEDVTPNTFQIPSVRNGANAIGNRQTLRTVAILLSLMDEVSIAALESETAGEILEAFHDVRNGRIKRVDIHGGQRRLPLLNVAKVLDKALRFRERFHLLHPFPQPNGSASPAPKADEELAKEKFCAEMAKAKNALALGVKANAIVQDECDCWAFC